MVLAAGAVLHEAHELQLGAVQLGVGLGVEAEGLAGQIGEAQSGHTARGAGEGQLDEIGADADRLKDLGAVVAGQQGDADLREDLPQAILQGGAHIGLGPGRREGGQLAPLDQGTGLGMGQPVAGGLPGEPGAHRAGAITDQTGQVVGAPALGRVDHDRGLQPQPQAQQKVMHGAHRQQRRDVGGAGADRGGLAAGTDAVGEHQDLAAGAHGGLRLKTKALQGLLQTAGAVGHRQQGGQGGGGQALIPQGGEFCLVKHR